MVDDPNKHNSIDEQPSEQQLDQIYQQAMAKFEPSELLDKRIQRLAKQQAEQILDENNNAKRSYSWASAPWWANAASLACVGVLGWWLFSETMVPPSEMQYQSDIQLMRSSAQGLKAFDSDAAIEQDAIALEQQRTEQHTAERQLAEQHHRSLQNQQKRAKRVESRLQEEQYSALKSVQAKLSRQAMTIDSEADIAAESEAAPEVMAELPTVQVISDVQLVCVEQALVLIRPEQLQQVAVAGLSIHAKQAFEKKANLLSWQQVSWRLLALETELLLVNNEPLADHSLHLAEIYRLPESLVEKCQANQ